MDLDLERRFRNRNHHDRRRSGVPLPRPPQAWLTSPLHHPKKEQGSSLPGPWRSRGGWRLWRSRWALACCLLFFCQNEFLWVLTSYDPSEKTNLKNGKDDPILAYKSCAARELYEETGIDLRGSLDRLEPLQLKEPKGKLPCEYKQRIFFSAEIFDHDIALQDEMVALTSSLTQAVDKSPPDAMVRSMIYSR